MTTLFQMTDRVMKILQGGPYGQDIVITRGLARETVKQALNRVLKVRAMEPTAFGHIQVPACAEVRVDVAVGETDGRAFLTLPYHPLTLPKDVGVFAVYPVGDPFNPFIPIPSGWGFALGGVTHNKLAAVLDQHICYERHGDRLYFNKPQSEVGTTVTVVLLGQDMTHTTSDYDIMPLSVDMEDEVVRLAVELLANTRPPDERGDDNANVNANTI
ncbi:MAG: hypothetical protein D6746_07220 [Bacteroidetes bacterium]|nr:MAG: hypothetical protein D6746_07220 [Bacteroidota bacterium]